MLRPILQSDTVSRICFALVHLIGMSSAFSNPILYGWFNEAFRTEFQNIARQASERAPISSRNLISGSKSTLSISVQLAGFKTDEQHPVSV